MTKTWTEYAESFDFITDFPAAEGVTIPLPNINTFKKYYVSSSLAEAAKGGSFVEAAGKPFDNFLVIGDYLYAAKNKEVFVARLAEIGIDTGNVIGSSISLDTHLSGFVANNAANKYAGVLADPRAAKLHKSMVQKAIQGKYQQRQMLQNARHGGGGPGGNGINILIGNGVLNIQDNINPFTKRGVTERGARGQMDVNKGRPMWTRKAGDVRPKSNTSGMQGGKPFSSFGPRGGGQEFFVSYNSSNYKNSNFNREIVAVEIGDLHQFSNEVSYQFDVLSFVMIGLYIFAIIRYKSRKLLTYCQNKFKIVVKHSRTVFSYLNLNRVRKKYIKF